MRIACVQSNVTFSDPTANAESAVRQLVELRSQGVDLTVFPEAYLTGYCVGSASDANDITISASDPSIQRIDQACQELDVLCVAGFAERDESGNLYNSAALFEPGKPVRFYRKTHLPYLGYDRFALVGSELEPFETRLGRIGVLICYDLRPPEATRTLVLKGADLIVLPTNWPVGAEVSADHMAIARAAENRVFMATCNRVGTENGTSFIGRSKIVHCSGRVLAAANEREEIIVADVDLNEARQKRIVNIPGEYELEVLASRQPELYRVITESNR